MKLFIKFFFWFFVLLVAGTIAISSVTYIRDRHIQALQGIISPLPKLLSNIFYKEADATYFWQPRLNLVSTYQKPLILSAKAAISYDTSTDTMIFVKEINSRLPIASLTKIMTAVIALENLDLNQEVTVGARAAGIGEDSMGLSYNEKFKLEDLVYGMILKSGNDAAEVVAEASKFKRADYIHLMNKKAEDLGLSNTRFTNPTGLQGDGEQYSTAKELLVLTRYALQKEEFAKIAATYEYDIDATSKHKAYVLYNETNLLTTYPGVMGVKTGYTDEAGLCLVTYLDFQGHKIIAILLNSQNRRAEMGELLDYSLKSLGIAPPPHS